jgi:hypothetical protein
MTLQIAEASFRSRVGSGGLVSSIVVAAGGIIRSFARSPLFVHDDATATALNLLASEPLFRLGAAANLIAVAFYVAVSLIVPHLLELAGASFFLLSAFFGALGNAMSVAGTVYHLAPLAILASAHHLIAF